MTVTHSTVVAVPDDPAYPVGSDEWNDPHVVSLTSADVGADPAGSAATAQAAAIAAAATDATTKANAAQSAAISAAATDATTKANAAQAAAIAASQPVDSDLTAIAALTTTVFGRDFLIVADINALVAMLQPYFVEPS